VVAIWRHLRVNCRAQKCVDLSFRYKMIHVRQIPYWPNIITSVKALFINICYTFSTGVSSGDVVFDRLLQRCQDRQLGWQCPTSLLIPSGSAGTRSPSTTFICLRYYQHRTWSSTGLKSVPTKMHGGRWMTSRRQSMTSRVWRHSPYTSCECPQWIASGEECTVNRLKRPPVNSVGGIIYHIARFEKEVRFLCAC
jgi:hypothetical protein